MVIWGDAELKMIAEQDTTLLITSPFLLVTNPFQHSYSICAMVVNMRWCESAVKSIICVQMTGTNVQ